MANVKHAIIRTDLMMGTTVGTYLASLRYMGADGNTATEIDNGNVVAVGNLMEGEREVRVATTPTAKTALKDVAVIAAPEVFYDERKRELEEFTNEAGKTVRGYFLHTGDMFSVTAEALNIASGATPAVGYAVELMAGTKLNVAQAATSGSTQVGVIHAIEKAGRYTYYVIRVV